MVADTRGTAPGHTARACDRAPPLLTDGVVTRAAARRVRRPAPSSPPARTRRSRAGPGAVALHRARTPTASWRSPRPRRAAGDGVALAVADADGRARSARSACSTRPRRRGTARSATGPPRRPAAAASPCARVVLLRDWAVARARACASSRSSPTRDNVPSQRVADARGLRRTPASCAGTAAAPSPAGLRVARRRILRMIRPVPAKAAQRAGDVASVCRRRWPSRSRTAS